VGSDSGIVGTDSGKSAKVPTINRNGCPRSNGMGAHDAPEYAAVLHFSLFGDGYPIIYGLKYD
jgi:hypothetical protein